MSNTIDHELLSNLAYQLWLDRGQPIGSPEIDWNLAAKLCKQQRSPAVDQGRAREHGEQTASSASVTSNRTHINDTLQLVGEGATVPLEVPPTTPVPPDVPPTKARAPGTTQSKTSSKLSKA